MTVIVCVDDQMGMIFGGKRQSRDRVMLADMAEQFGHVWISPFSEKLLSQHGLSYTVSDAPLEMAGDSDAVFVENIDLLPYRDKISKIVLYHWGRRYLADERLTLIPKAEGYRLVSTYKFQGSSHEKIKREIYER